MTREEGMALSLKYDGKRPASLDYFLNILGISESEFIDIVKNNQVSDWGFEPDKLDKGEELPDMKDWDNFV